MHPDKRWAILMRDNGICGICAGPITQSPFDIDHIVEVRAGGTDAPENLRPAHPRCNRRRGARRVPGAYARPDSLGADVARVRVHMTSDLHERVKRQAGRDMRSLNLEILWLLERGLESVKEDDQPARKPADAS